MGMYTEIDLRVKLSLDTSLNIIKWLSLQANSKVVWSDEHYKLLVQNTPKELVNTRVKSLLWNDDYILRFRKLKDCYFLRCRFEIKNYESELELLVNTLKPYIINRGKIGTLLYEEYDKAGDITYNENEEIDFDYGSTYSDNSYYF